MQSSPLPIDKALDFIMGGRAIFTAVSKRTQIRYTYKCITTEKKIMFVSVLTGSDNNSDYTPMTVIKFENGYPEISKDKRNRMSENDKRIEGFNYIFMNLLIKREMLNIEIWHEGRCRRCGRLLTVPESIESGVGPECAGKANIINL